MTEEQAPYNKKQPTDAVLVKQIESIGFYFSKQEHMFYLETADYHEGLVALSRVDIIELLSIIDQQTVEKEKDLIADLEQDDDDF